MTGSIKRIVFFHLCIVSFSAILVSCGGEEEPTPDDGNNNDPCKNGPVLSISDMLHSYVGKNSGYIKVSVSGGNGAVLYSINGSEYSEKKVFEDLGTGSYTIEAKDTMDCTSSVQVEIEEFPEVSFDTEVLPILSANCNVSGCHGSAPGLPTWDSYSTVKANADRIRFRVGGKTMPPPSSGKSLSDDQIMTILNWIDVGAPDN